MQWPSLNVYGKVILLCALAGVGTLVVGGLAYWWLWSGFFGIGALTIARAMHVNAPEPETYPQDREDDAEERRRNREGELEGHKGSMGHSY